MALRHLARTGWPAAVACAAIVSLAPVAGADWSQPVPLNGAYDTFLDHPQQTFNGQPRPSEPSIQPAKFATTCAAGGCIAHWLLVDPLTDNPNAPSLFDYQWANDRGGWGPD